MANEDNLEMVRDEQKKTRIYLYLDNPMGGKKTKHELCTCCWLKTFRPSDDPNAYSHLTCNGRGVSDVDPCLTPLEERPVVYAD